MSYQISVNGIVVIDFLGESEYKTGRSLNESYISTAWAECPNRFYHHAPTRQIFFAVLEGIANAAENQGFRPIIHIESHGGECGISIDRDGDEFIPWQDLKPYLQRINRYSGLNLLVVMSACKGAYLMRTIQVTEPSIAWAVMGPTITMAHDALLADYARFYAHFFGTYQFLEAFESLNNNKNTEENPYQVASAEFFFYYTFGQYVALAGSRKEIERRVDRNMTALSAFRGCGRQAMRVVRDKLIREMSDHRAHFERFKRIYFLEDEFPGMSDRFEVSYEKALERGRVGQ